MKFSLESSSNKIVVSSVNHINLHKLDIEGKWLTNKRNIIEPSIKSCGTPTSKCTKSYYLFFDPMIILIFKDCSHSDPSNYRFNINSDYLQVA